MGPVVAIVLAAGAGRRFGGGKLVASLDGRPILQHVLDALAEAGIPDPVVVVGSDATLVEAIDWRAATVTRNPDPARGLASSLQVGWAAAMTVEPRPAAAIVVLGDQPLLDPAVIRALAAAPADATRPILVARHGDGVPNPVRLEPEADALVAQAAGDRGLGPVLEAHPDLVRFLDVGGTNPDIDRPADLVALLEARWADRVRANGEQVERFREAPDGNDFYASVSRTFIADPARDDDSVLDALIGLARPDEVWLDIGAGAGRYALPLARRVRNVVALDPSASMIDALRAAIAEHHLGNIRVLAGRWPPDDTLRSDLGPDPIADVALVAHVGYDIAAIGPFLLAMEAAARRLCVAVLMDQGPASAAAAFWPPVHGEPRVPLPALPALVELLRGRGRAPTVTLVDTARRRWASRAEVEAFVRRQTWTAPGSVKDHRMLELLDAWSVLDADGSAELLGAEPLSVGVVAWSPPSLRHQLSRPS